MKKLLLIILLICNFMLAEQLVKILPYKSNEFSPALKQSFQIPFELKQEANITINIYTPDNNLIRSLIKSNVKKGKNFLKWDGKDFKGTIVPDEAYNIVLIAKSKNKKEVIDPRLTGGFVIKNLERKIDKRGNIRYKLPSPARVLIRAGIENSCMLKVISNWAPKNKGLVLQKWNMKDSNEVIDISKLNFAVSISAFELPKYAIITTNNKQKDYLNYFKENNFKCNSIPIKQQILKRENRGISTHFYKCRIEERDPKLNIIFPNKKKLNEIPVIKENESIIIKITTNSDDEKLLEKVKYEISFFIDFQFTSEEELGYIPILWNFKPFGLKKGEHILTVNITSFNGQVGVESIKFLLE